MTSHTPSDPSRQATQSAEPPSERPGDLIAWITERRDNSQHIADKKRGDDRAGWLEDAQYFEAVRAALSAQATPPSPAAPQPDSQRCIKARNDLWAVLDGPGSVVGSLEEAVEEACARIRHHAPQSAEREAK